MRKRTRNRLMSRCRRRVVVQGSAQYFTNHAFGKVVAEFDATRHLVARQALAAECPELSLCRLLARPQDHPGPNRFTLGLVWHSGYADLGDAWVGGECLFDLAWPHLVAAG